MINFGELKVFPSATGQHNLITVLQKKSLTNSQKVQAAQTIITKHKGYLGEKALIDIVSGTDDNTDCYTIPQAGLWANGNLKLTSGGIDEVLDKMLISSIKLGAITQVNQGIVTGADKISQKHILNFPNLNYQKDEGIYIVNEGKFGNSTDLKPWFKNSDILKYSVKSLTRENLIFADKRNVNFDENLLEHLLKYKLILDKSTSNSPYLHRPRGKFFDLPKIVAPQRSRTNTFGYNEIPWYASADVYFITQPKNGYQLKFLLGVLNSQLIYQWLYNRGKRKGEMLELYQEPLSNIPIPTLNTPIKQQLANQIEALVEEILSIKQMSPESSIQDLENQIDLLVYKLYDLTPTEIELIQLG